MSSSYDAMDMVRNRNGSDRDRDMWRRSSESEERPSKEAAASSKESAAEKPKEAKKSALDREKTCPLLLRVFCSTSRHNGMMEYSRGRNNSLHSSHYSIDFSRT